MKTVKEICGKELESMTNMLKRLVKHREEIFADRAHVAVVRKIFHFVLYPIILNSVPTVMESQGKSWKN